MRAKPLYRIEKIKEYIPIKNKYGFFHLYDPEVTFILNTYGSFVVITKDDVYYGDIENVNNIRYAQIQKHGNKLYFYAIGSDELYVLQDIHTRELLEHTKKERLPRKLGDARIIGDKEAYLGSRMSPKILNIRGDELIDIPIEGVSKAHRVSYQDGIIAIYSNSYDRDVILIYDVNECKTLRRLDIDKASDIKNINIALAGDYVYVLDRKEGKLSIINRKNGNIKREYVGANYIISFKNYAIAINSDTGYTRVFEGTDMIDRGSIGVVPGSIYYGYVYDDKIVIVARYGAFEISLPMRYVIERPKESRPPKREDDLRGLLTRLNNDLRSLTSVLLIKIGNMLSVYDSAERAKEEILKEIEEILDEILYDKRIKGELMKLIEKMMPRGPTITILSYPDTFIDTRYTSKRRKP